MACVRLGPDRRQPKHIGQPGWQLLEIGSQPAESGLFAALAPSRVAHWLAGPCRCLNQCADPLTDLEAVGALRSSTSKRASGAA
jgi:hypothetical protein